MVAVIAVTQLLIFMAYVAYVQRKFGVLPSISASTELFDFRDRWWFLIFLSSIGVLNLFQGMEGYGVVAAGGLMFTGITIDHYTDKSRAKEVHYIAVSVAIAAIFLGFIVLHGLWFSTILLIGISVAMLLLKTPNFIWYAEILAMILVTISYITIHLT